MNINDYIRATKRNIYALKPECLEDGYTLECLSALASSVDASIIVKPIFSTSIFPEMVYLNGVAYLLWDLHFWEIYKTILINCFFLYENEELLEKPHKFSSNMINCITNRHRLMLLDVLTSKLDKHPQVAYRLAQEQYYYRELLKREKGYNFEYSFDEKKSIEISQTIFYSKLFVLMHEIHHDYFKKDKKYHSDAILFQQTVAEVFMDNVDFRETTVNNRTIKSLNMRAYENQETLEESACDLGAFKLVYKFLLMVNSDLSPEVILEWLYNAFATCIYTVETFNFVTFFWSEMVSKFKEYYQEGGLILDDVIKKIETYEANAQNRLTFLSFAIYADLFHTGVEVSKNLFRKGDKISRFISVFAKDFLDSKYVAVIHHEAQNLKTKKSSPKFFRESINLILGNPYE